MTLTNDHKRPRTQLAATIPMTAEKLRGATQSAGVSVKVEITLSINNNRIDILNMLKSCDY